MARQTKKDIDLYQSFFDSSEAALIIAGEDGTITHANNKFIELSGFKSSEILRKKKWPDLVVNGNLARMKQHQEFIDPALSDSLLSADFKFVTKNGAIRDVLITRNPMGNTRNTALSFIDITDFVTAGKKVSLSEEKYRSLIESTDDSVYMIDRQGTYIFVNRQVLARLCV
ncbi:MAG: PAS domain S-box protein, partial [Syntrophorhabdus sp.]